MISYGKQSIDKSNIDAVVDVFYGDWLTQGPAVETFENGLKTYFGAKYCCAVSNATATVTFNRPGTGLATWRYYHYFTDHFFSNCKLRYLC